jgi:hypothetical protein
VTWRLREFLTVGKARWVVTAGLVFVLVLAVVARAGGTQARHISSPSLPAGAGPQGGGAGPGKNGVTGPTTSVPKPGYRPSYIVVPDNSQQQQWDAQIASKMPVGLVPWMEANAASMPACSYSRPFPPVPPADRSDQIAYADAYVTELLSVQFAGATRAQLLAWARCEGADFADIPGAPDPLGEVGGPESLIYTPQPNAGIMPIPAPVQWAARAAQGVKWSVSGVTGSVDPSWNQIVAAGFVDRDPLLAMIDVSGTLTVARPLLPPVKGSKAVPAASVALTPFELEVQVGGDLYRPGYGAADTQNWGPNS